MAQFAPDRKSVWYTPVFLHSYYLQYVCMYVHIAAYIAPVVQVAEEQAALDALSELGMQQGGAEAILLHPCQVIQDVTSKALGRAPSPDVTLAAVHALATIAGHPHTPLLAHPPANCGAHTCCLCIKSL